MVMWQVVKLFLVVGKDFIIFPKDELEEQGEINPLGDFHLIFVAQNRQRFEIPFLVTALINNVEVTILGHNTFEMIMYPHALMQGNSPSTTYTQLCLNRLKLASLIEIAISILFR